MSYTHHISLNGSDYIQVYPTNGVEVTTEQEPNCIFFRDKVSEVKINRAQNTSIYDSLESYFTNKSTYNTQIEYEIYKGVRTGTAFYKALFSILDCSINTENKYIVIPMRTNDKYREVMEKYDVTFDITPTILNKQIGVQSIATIVWNAGGPGGIADFDTFTEGAEPGIISSLINTLGIVPQARYTNLGNVVSQDVIVTRVKAYTDSGATGLEMRLDDGAGGDKSFGGPVAITGTGYYAAASAASSPLYFVLYAPALFSGSITIDIWVVTNRVSYGGVAFTSLVDEFISDMGLALTVDSTILDNDALPSDAPSTIDAWITSYASGNYVTATQTTNILNDFFIGNARRWDESYEKYNLSLSVIMRDLANALNMYWYIDDDGAFRIEHKMYFDYLYFDCTPILTSTYLAYKPEVDALTYIARKEEIASREEFTWAQNTYEDADFNGLPIIYDVFETSTNIKKYELGLTTDVNFLVNSADSSKSGWVYYHVKYFDLATDIYIVDYTVGTLSSTEKLNGYFSWANIHNNYWSYGRMSENANINGVDVTADSVIPFVEQEGIKFPYPTAISWYTRITTSMGDAYIISMTRELYSDFISFKLAYNLYE